MLACSFFVDERVMPLKKCTRMDGYRETNNNLKSDIPKKKKRDPEGSRWINSQ